MGKTDLVDIEGQSDLIHFVLLSGGSGTRLWPLSNGTRSKQFLKVLPGENGSHISMVQRAFNQVENLEMNHDVTIAACESQRGILEMQLDGEFELVLEPERRDTAPAIMLACAHLRWMQNAAPEDTVIVMPIDTFADQSFYSKAAELADVVQNGKAELSLIGVKPTYPSEKYGYVLPSSFEGTSWPVAEFKEKPDSNDASGFIDHGGLWNCGVFAFKLSYLLNILESYINARSFDDVLQRYGDLPKRSFDYEVVEQAESVAVVPYSGVWKDLGTWNTLTEEMVDETAGRVITDSDSCSNVHVVNETGMPMVVAGMSDTVVVATPDGILVSSKDASTRIKEHVSRVAISRPMYEQRDWGEYRVVDFGVAPDGRKSLVKRLIIKPGKQLSYQVHLHRSEIWTVISGSGEIVLNDCVRPIVSGCLVEIMSGVKHSCRAFDELHIVEVQLGETLVEEDIERFGEFWDGCEGANL